MNINTYLFAILRNLRIKSSKIKIYTYLNIIYIISCENNNNNILNSATHLMSTNYYSSMKMKYRINEYCSDVHSKHYMSEIF